MKNDRKTSHELMADLESAYQRVYKIEALFKERGYGNGNEPEHPRPMSDIRESEIHYRRLFETARDGILILDAESGAITDANPFIREILGYSPEDLIGKRLWEIGALFDISASKSAFEELKRKEYIRYDNLPLQTKDGQICEVEFVSNVYLVDFKKVIQCNIRNISKRREAEKALEESEIRYRRLFESARDGILILDAETGNIIAANPFLLEILNYSQENVIGKELWEIGPFKYIITNQDTFRKLQNQEYIKYQGLNLQNKDGLNVHMEFVSSYYFVNDRKVIQCNIRDITEREKMEEGLRKIQKLEGLGTLAGGIAHDFNNILGIILAYITSSKRFKDDAAKLDLAVNTIVKAVERGKTLVQQILTFARKTETEFGVVNINDVIMETMAMTFETFPKNITYSQNLDKSIKNINADRSQLYQVLLNLCINARDALPGGGILTINTRMESVVSLRNQHPDAFASSYVCIEVSDSGEGMTEEIQKRIFEPFFTTKGIGKGTGLGLAVVFGIIQTHNGFIDVESEVGKGTTFRIYLPATQVAEPISEENEGALKEISGGTETLLVIEDEEMLMMSLQMVLVEKGYKVITALDGLAAVKIYQENKGKIALVITDLGLPTITGLEVCQRIRKINPNEHIILATGFLDPEMKSEFLKAGLEHFLYKPYNIGQVLKVVREVLDEK